MKIWVIALLIFLGVDFLIVLWVVIKRGRANRMDAKALQYIKSHWIRIIDSFNHDPRHAILDADKLLDFALRKHGFEGSLGEKLKRAGARFSDINGVWVAHKLRNKVAHELGDIDRGEAKRALKHFKKGLNDLGAEL